ncbi:MAG: hypothetical protein LBR56_03850, partial [Sporomusaceae bacterium]|nr:hypothetical protein [Sporomusaceae bacterium]
FAVLTEKGQLILEEGKNLNAQLRHNLTNSVGTAAGSGQEAALAGLMRNLEQLTPAERAQIQSKLQELAKTAEC